VLRRRARRGLATTLWLPEELRKALETEAKEHSPRETGGMLIGYATDGAIVVTRSIDGGPNSVRKRDRFEPDGEWQQVELERIYRASGRIETFLGDWHSHPRGLGRPSRRDRATARAVARSRSSRAPNPLTLITARTWRGGWELAAFLYIGRSGFQRLEVESYPNFSGDE
jgi:integrative and conjugative element protein (TIGR02256 family)